MALQQLLRNQIGSSNQLTLGDQIEQYRSLLAIERRTVIEMTTDTSHYHKLASPKVLFHGDEINTFAPFEEHRSAFRRLTSAQGVVLITVFVLLLGIIILYSERAFIGLLALATALYVSDLLFNLCVTVRATGHQDEEVIDDRVVFALNDATSWPMYTILCPLFKEANIVSQFAETMKNIDYPEDRLQILLLTEKEDIETREAIHQLRLPSQFEVLVVPKGQPQTKPRACNYGLLHSRGDYTVIYDAEDAPDVLQLKKAVLTFATYGKMVACVQAKLNFYNTRQNLLTRWFTAEYSLWFDTTLPGLQSLYMALPLGGTSNHFRTQTLRKLAGWDVFNVTEDCDLGLRLAMLGYSTKMLDSTTFEEANSHWGNWLRQRSRWIKGYIQTYFVHMRRPRRYLHPKRWRQFISLQLVVGGKVFVLLVNPLMWLLLLIYVTLRAQVEREYHVLFPSAILYLSAFSLIFGNFSYMYAHLVSCVKRGQYRLMWWVFLIPLYWVCMSVAAFIAVTQFIFRPFYWEKTKHGLHLAKGAQAISLAGVDAVSVNRRDLTVTLSAPNPDIAHDEESLTTLEAIQALTTRRYSHETSAILSSPMPIKRAYAAWHHDRWFVASITVAILASCSAVVYAYQNHLILLWNDSHFHMQIARRVFDNLTPGLAQLGAIWLPLPHLLMEPFIWNDALWRTGLAGSFVGITCNVITAIALFLLARRLTHDSRASFIGALIFIVNPNMLYIQTTPLSEPVLVATLTLACYYFVAWVQDEQLPQLIMAAFVTFLATLARYDGWALYIVFLVTIILIALIRRQPWRRTQAQLMIFGTLGGLGIVLWFVWNAIIFGDPLYFQRSLFSSQAQQQVQITYGNDQTYHQFFQAFRYYSIVAAQTLGPLMLATGIIAVLIFLYRHKFTPESLATLTILTPFAFYVVALYSGQAIIWAPGAVPPEAAAQLYNIRYGVEVIAPFALFTATLISQLPRLSVIISALLVIQTTLTCLGGIVTLQDGLIGVDCFHTTAILPYFARHYDSGFILIDPFYNPLDLTEAGINNGALVSEGIDPYWTRALVHPESVVDWVVVKPGDIISQHLDVSSPAFLSQFYLVAQDNQFQIALFRRRNLPPVPTRPLPDDLQADPYRLCDMLV